MDSSEQGIDINLAPTVVIRTDANVKIGTGHLMRCLALAQAWKDAGGKVIFITACQSQGLLQRLKDEGFDIHSPAHSYPDPSDWEYTKDILAAYRSAWVVLDGYHFDEVYQQQVKDAGHRLLVMDDMAYLKHYYGDIVLNQNLHAGQLNYSCESYTRLLLGTRYVLLRREFLAWQGWKREIPGVARRLLVTLGGSDPENYTLKVIQTLQKIDIPGLEAIVVIGASNPNAGELKEAIGQSEVPIRLIRDAKNMAELMVWADATISAGGSTVWELAFMGLPSIILVFADNQREVAGALHQAGAAVSLGWANRIGVLELVKKLGAFLRDSDGLRIMAQRVGALVDGQGTNRVIMRILGEKLRLRQARDEDCRLLWEWRNDPVVRVASFSSEFIPWEEHVRWFKPKLSDTSCYFYILLNEQDVPIGQVRFDISDGEAETDVSIAPSFRSCGYGAAGIRISSKRLFQEAPVTQIHADVKPSNDASVCAFRKAGYRMSGTKVVKGDEALRMTLDRNTAQILRKEEQNGA